MEISNIEKLIKNFKDLEPEKLCDDGIEKLDEVSKILKDIQFGIENGSNIIFKYFTKIKINVAKDKVDKNVIDLIKIAIDYIGEYKIYLES